MSSNNDMLEIYIYESNTLLEQLENINLESERSNIFTQEQVNEIFRIMHTIKGSSAMMEFDSISTVAHHIEDLFFLIREGTMDVVSDADRPALFELMFQSVDFFRAELERITNGKPLSTDIDSFLENINSLLQRIKGESAASEIPSVASSDSDLPLVSAGNAAFPYQLRVFFDEGCGMENLRAFMLVNSICDFCNESDFIFEPADVENDASTADQIIKQGFLLEFRNAKDREHTIPTVRSVGSINSYQSHDYVSPAAVVEFDSTPAEITFQESELSLQDTALSTAATAVSAASAAAAGNQAAAVQHQKESLISVNLSKLDQLSALVGEIVITEAMVTASPDLKGIENLDTFAKSARQLRKLTDELQDVSMSLRMVPISNTFQKMNRIVRDMGKKLGKDVTLTLIGADTEVDKTIVDSIGDPIMHMIRNSMDHGIEETEAERIAAGKNPVGEIILSAQDTGSEVIITIQDDGKGVNDDAVLKKAIKNGLASPDGEYSHKDILNFLLMPGFSTNSQVTEYSGRGVGMDVVKRSVEELGGSVSITSEYGKGMTTTMKIPLTMAIMDGMEVSVGDAIFTIPINNIRQSLKVSSADILHDSVDGEMIKLMDNYYPIIRARNHYNLPGGVENIEDGILMWLESGNCSYALFVDKLLGEQQIVVKPLPSYVNNFDIKKYGISGCSILGDGNISIILDVGSLYASTNH